jgi:hypothetical protein
VLTIYLTTWKSIIIKMYEGHWKITGILWRRRFGAPWVRAAWTGCYWSFLRASFAEVGRCTSEEAVRQVAGRDSGFCMTLTYRATLRLLCSTSSQKKTFLSSPDHRTLRISPRVTFVCPYSEYGPQGDKFLSHGGHQIESNGQTPQDSKSSLPSVLPTMAG